jgi:hypothetical protein
MEEFDGEMEGLPSKDLLVEPPLPPSLLGSAIGGGLVIAVFAALLALAFEYATLGEIGTNTQLTGWLAVWSGVACGSGIIIGAKEVADSTDSEIEQWMNQRKQHNSFLKTEEYKELKKSEKAKEREEFKKSDYWWLTKGMLWFFMGFVLLMIVASII